MRILTGEQYQKEQNVDNVSKQDDQQLDKEVLDIIKEVCHNGDQALMSFTEEFDGVSVESLRVTEEEFVEARSLVSPEFIEALQKAAERIRTFHENQVEKSWFTNEDEGILLGQKEIGRASCRERG